MASTHNFPFEKLISPYSLNPPPFCYPGSLVPAFLNVTFPIILQQLNMIGTHTHGEIKGEGGFETAQKMERDAIFWISKMVYKTNQTDVSELVDGYFSSGATESNLMGLWLGRNYLYSRTKETPTLLITALAHYSFIKSANIVDITSHDDNVRIIKHNRNFEMDVDDLERVIQKLIVEGKKNVIIGLTVGTSACGSIDPIWRVNSIVNKYSVDLNFYIHVDAAFGGFTVPFVTNNIFIGFEHSNVMSIAIDGHKMGDLPYPSGIFLCRKNLQRYTATHVNYIRGHCDDTVTGSRSSIGPITAYYMFFHHDGLNYYRDNALGCIARRDKFAELLAPIKHVTVHPFSPYVNILPVEIDIVDGKIPEELIEGELKDYHLRSDIISIDGVDHTIYKMCIMNHVSIKHIEQFVDIIKSIIERYRHTEL
jgi:tyrosine decarboxylase/aspartate 1-decarboxylase